MRGSIKAFCPMLQAAFQRTLVHEHSCVFGWGWWGGCWGKENQPAGPDEGGLWRKTLP